MAKSRFILIVCALIATILVEVLKFIGFSVADLAFSIYGGGLALCPPVIVALYVKKEKLKAMRNYAIIAIILGLFTGWMTAIVGKFINNGDMIFLAPCVSFGISAVIMLLGRLTTR